MKLILLIVTLSFFVHISVNAQWTIKHLNEKSRKSGVIKFKNESLGLLMGENLTLKSTDAGETWNVKPTGINIDVNDFQFVGDSSVFAVGVYYIANTEKMASKLIKSENLGESWDSISNFASEQLNSLHFFDNDSGLVAGSDEIYRTVDAGKSWSPVWGIKQNGYLYGAIGQICFPSSKIGYAIGLGRISIYDGWFDYFLLKTNNSGKTWASKYAFNESITSMYFINQYIGFIGTGSGAIYKTTDGGDTWNKIQLTNSNNAIRSMQFISESKGFAIGGRTTLILEEYGNFFISKTIDGGKTWAGYDTLGISLRSIYFINETKGFVSGNLELIMKSNGQINKLPKDYPWHLFSISNPNGMDENILASSRIKIYPNPTDGSLYIQNLNSNKKIQSIVLVNSSGQTVAIENPISDNECIQLNLSHLKSGMYFIRTQYADKTELMKIIKK